MTTIGLSLVLERLAQNEARLRLRSIVRIDHQQNAIDHLHDALDFAAEIGVAGRIDDVDAIAVPLKGGVLGADRDPFFALEIHRIHHALLDFLVGAEGARLTQQLIDQRGLAVIDVRNDGDVTDFIHSKEASSGGGGTIVGDQRRVKPSAARERRNSLHGYKGTYDLKWRSRNRFQCALRCRLDPFAVFADQILQAIHRFGFGNIEFHGGLADVEIHLAGRAADVAEIGVGHFARAVHDASHDRNLHAL